MPGRTGNSLGADALYNLLFYAWMALISYLSLTSMEDLDLGGPDIPYFDKVAHFGIYATTMVLGALYIRERFRARVRMGSSLRWMALALLLYGTVVEVLQAVGGQDRSAEWGDMAANAAGIGIGWWFSMWLFRRWKALNWAD